MYNMIVSVGTLALHGTRISYLFGNGSQIEMCRQYLSVGAWPVDLFGNGFQIKMQLASIWKWISDQDVQAISECRSLACSFIWKWISDPEVQVVSECRSLACIWSRCRSSAVLFYKSQLLEGAVI